MAARDDPWNDVVAAETDGPLEHVEDLRRCKHRCALPADQAEDPCPQPPSTLSSSGSSNEYQTSANSYVIAFRKSPVEPEGAPERAAAQACGGIPVRRLVDHRGRALRGVPQGAATCTAKLQAFLHGHHGEVASDPGSCPPPVRQLGQSGSCNCARLARRRRALRLRMSRRLPSAAAAATCRTIGSTSSRAARMIATGARASREDSLRRMPTAPCRTLGLGSRSSTAIRAGTTSDAHSSPVRHRSHANPCKAMVRTQGTGSSSA